MVRAGPGFGQLVISSTGEATLVRLTPNAEYTYNEVLYSHGEDHFIEIPAWYQAIITTSTNNFTGSRIVANRTVSVVSGSSCAYSPGTSSGVCDYVIEQLLPYDRWGTIFNVSPFNTGPTGYFVQVTAGRDNTTISLHEAEVTLDQGETHDIVIPNNTMIRLTSNQPVQVMQYMTEPMSMVLIPPEEQYTNTTAYIRMHAHQTHGLFLSHYFNIIVECTAISGFQIFYESTSQEPTPVSYHHSWSGNNGICGFAVLGNEFISYYIQPGDPDVKFYISIYGIHNGTASFAYIGTQRYERLRCIDYMSLLYRK